MSVAEKVHTAAGHPRRRGLGRRVRWALTACWAAVIFAASSLPGSNVPGRFGTLAHFVEYAVLGGLLYFALRLDMTPLRSAVYAVVIGSAYGVTDELHQMFTPGRVPDVMDWVVDTLGAAAGASAATALDRLRSTRSHPEPTPDQTASSPH